MAIRRRRAGGARRAVVPESANEAAATELTAALGAGDLRYPIFARLPLAEIAQAHELTEHSSASGRVVLEIDETPR